jgi:hypothetical protein
MNDIFYEVHVHIDVYVVLMLNYIFGDLDGTLIVTQEGGWMLLLESKLWQDTSKPQGFLSCIKHFSVFNFY